jgi:hypothetical protein
MHAPADPERDGKPDKIAMIPQERVLRLLTIKPADLSKWTRLCNRLNNQAAAAHPEYPVLRDMQLMSFVKRLLPEIRTMIAAIDKSS